MGSNFFLFNFFYGRPEFEGLINEQDEEGNTPSNIATINGHTYMAQRLEKGRDEKTLDPELA